MTEYRELLAGCGNRRDKTVRPANKPNWENLTTLDIDPNTGADIEWDLTRLPLPFDDEYFDEMHFYHILEHTGQMGDWRFFFAQFSDFWRLLKPDGLFCGIVPSVKSPWLFGDPGHTRIITPESFTFLSQAEYARQIGATALTDYRHVYKADFEIAHVQELDDHEQVAFVLRAVKPSRISI